MEPGKLGSRFPTLMKALFYDFERDDMLAVEREIKKNPCNLPHNASAAAGRELARQADPVGTFPGDPVGCVRGQDGAPLIALARKA